MSVASSVKDELMSWLRRRRSNAIPPPSSMAVVWTAVAALRALVSMLDSLKSGQTKPFCDLIEGQFEVNSHADWLTIVSNTIEV